MKNKKFILITLITLLTAFFVCGPVLAGPAEEEKLRKFFEGYNIPSAELGEAARVVTNSELKPILDGKNYFKQVSEHQNKPFNPISYTEFLSLAYDRPHGTLDNNPKYPWAGQRYIGHTNKDEAFTNFWFRPDFVPGGGFKIHEARWIENPRKSPLVSQFVTQFGETGLEDNPFRPRNVGSTFRPYIAWGLEALADEWPQHYKFNAKAAAIKDWENYVHILQPPSYWCFGTGRMFHQAMDGSIWYLDVPLLPGFMRELDLAAKLEKDKYEGNPGEKIDTTVEFSLAPGYKFPVQAELKVYIETENDIIELQFTPVDPSKKIVNGKYTFQPGEKLVVNASFTVPHGSAELVAGNHVDVRALNGRTVVEYDTDNNEDRAPIISEQHDLKIRIQPRQPVFKSFDGDKTAVVNTVIIARKDGIPGEIDATGFINGPAGYVPINLKMGQRSVTYTYNFTAGPGSYTIEAEIWPVGKKDAYDKDNRHVVTVTVVNETIKIDSKIRSDLIDGGPVYTR